MRLEVLISTMHQKNYEIIEKMKINSDAVVINQSDNAYSELINYEGNEILWINTTERGLSKSRNLAIYNSKAQICLIADDDLVYNDNYKTLVIEEFVNNPSIDVIAFCVMGVEREFKKYKNKSRKVNFMNSMKISSVEIAFKVSKIKEKNIKFNELFGAGAKYYMGEENIFLSQCLAKGLKIKYVPKYIANLHIGESAWFEGFNEKYFINRGASFTAMAPKFVYLLMLQFAVRKRKLYHHNFGMITALKYMLKGRSSYLKDSLKLS